jgi:hypothetical protein
MPERAIIRPADDELLRYGGDPALANMPPGWQPVAATTPTPPATVAFVRGASSPSDLTTYSLASGDLGGDYTIIGVGGVAGSATRTVSSLSANSVSGSFVERQNHTNGSNFGLFSEIWIVQGAGASGGISVTWSGGMTACWAVVWAANKLLSSTKTHSGGSTASPGTFNLNISAGGIAVGLVGINSGSAGSVSWGNLTTDYNSGNIEGGNYASGGSAAFAMAQSGLTITATRSSASWRPMVVASFR